MRKIIALILSCIMLLTGCLSSSPDSTTTTATEETTLSAVSESATASTEDTDVQENIELEDYIPEPKFVSPSDPELLNYVEDVVYSEVIKQLDSEEYLVEGVHAVYMPEEYFEEVEFNSKENVYFGYTASELENVFQGNKYVFTMGDDGQTQVQEMQTVPDDTYCRIMKNVATGSGVILVCTTVSLVAGVTAAPAISIIFAFSAAGAAITANSMAIRCGAIAGIVKGIQTGNVKSALRAAAAQATDGYKWGAISGAIVSGAAETFVLKQMTKSGLTMNEAAYIQMETQYPASVIEQFHSPEEVKIFQDAKLKPMIVDNKTALIRSDIDLNFVDDLGRTNFERMTQGLAPLDPTGVPYELHHVGQQSDGVLAILTKAEHIKDGNYTVLHQYLNDSMIDRAEFAAIRKAFWKDMANILTAA